MSANISKHERNMDFSVFSFLCILFVVAGHCEAPFLKMDIIPYNNFMVPAFVFIAGYFYNVDRSTSEQIKRKIEKLIIPYFYTHFCYCFFSVLLSHFGFNLVKKITGNLLFMELFFPRTLAGFNSPAWFIISLVYIEIIFMIVNMFIKKHMYFLYFIISLFIGIVAVQISINYGSAIIHSKNALFLTGLRTSVLLPFFYFGRVYACKEKERTADKRIIVIILILIVSCVLCMEDSGVYDKTIIDYKQLSFASPIVTYMCGIFGILFWINISKIVSPCIGKIKMVSVISENTFSIMTHHLFGFFVTNSVFIFVKWITKNEYIDYIDDYYNYPRSAPFSKGALRWGYLIMGVGISILIHELYCHVNNMLKVFLVKGEGKNE